MSEVTDYDSIKGVVDKEGLRRYLERNRDDYGGACVKVVINVMKYLDGFKGEFNIGYAPDMTTPHGIISHCDDQGGLTGFMAGVVRNIVTRCYKDGWKFFLAYQITPYDLKDGAVFDLNKLVRTLEEFASEQEIREYVTALVQRHVAMAKPPSRQKGAVVKCNLCGSADVTIGPYGQCDTCAAGVAGGKQAYTVVLMYPDYMTDNYGLDCFVQSCEAESVEEAVRIIRKECQESNEAPEDADDLAVLLVMAGDVKIVADSSHGL